jgi:CRISPR/Cas system-associated exonuclease Cas4 (RecB family)
MPEYYRGQRTKNLFDPRSNAPFKLSRSKLENFLRCPRCFYLDRRLGIAQPSGPPFSLNAAVDHLLKKEFDHYRRRQEPHPLMIAFKIAAVPFAHPKLDEWRRNFVGISFFHQPSNFILSGAIDDVWINPAGELLIVDYKATSKDREVNLDAEWQLSYKNQMEIYQWLFRRNGFSVSATGYFVYLNGRRDRDSFNGRLEFAAKIIPYQGKSEWVEEALERAKGCLLGNDLPPPAPACEFCSYRRRSRAAEKVL